MLSTIFFALSLGFAVPEQLDEESRAKSINTCNERLKIVRTPLLEKLKEEEAKYRNGVGERSRVDEAKARLAAIDKDPFGVMVLGIIGKGSPEGTTARLGNNAVRIVKHLDFGTVIEFGYTYRIAGATSGFDISTSEASEVARCIVVPKLSNYRPTAKAKLNGVYRVHSRQDVDGIKCLVIYEVKIKPGDVGK